MVERAGVQPESFRLIAPDLVDGPLQKPGAESLADKFGHQPELHQFDFVALATVQLGESGRRAVDMQDVYFVLRALQN